MPITRKILPAALAIAAAAAPATASARPPAEFPNPPRGAIVIPPDPRRSSGFDWPDAGVGAGVAIFIVAAGSAAGLRRRHRLAVSRS